MGSLQLYVLKKFLKFILPLLILAVLNHIFAVITLQSSDQLWAAIDTAEELVQAREHFEHFPFHFEKGIEFIIGNTPLPDMPFPYPLITYAPLQRHIITSLFTLIPVPFIYWAVGFIKSPDLKKPIKLFRLFSQLWWVGTFLQVIDMIKFGGVFDSFWGFSLGDLLISIGYIGTVLGLLSLLPELIFDLPLLLWVKLRGIINSLRKRIRANNQDVKNINSVHFSSEKAAEEEKGDSSHFSTDRNEPQTPNDERPPQDPHRAEPGDKASQDPTRANRVLQEDERFKLEEILRKYELAVREAQETQENLKTAFLIRLRNQKEFLEEAQILSQTKLVQAPAAMVKEILTLQFEAAEPLVIYALNLQLEEQDYILLLPKAREDEREAQKSILHEVKAIHHRGQADAQTIHEEALRFESLLEDEAEQEEDEIYKVEKIGTGIFWKRLTQNWEEALKEIEKLQKRSWFQKALQEFRVYQSQIFRMGSILTLLVLGGVAITFGSWAALLGGILLLLVIGEMVFGLVESLGELLYSTPYDIQGVEGRLAVPAISEKDLKILYAMEGQELLLVNTGQFVLPRISFYRAWRHSFKGWNGPRMFEVPLTSSDHGILMFLSYALFSLIVPLLIQVAIGIFHLGQENLMGIIRFGFSVLVVLAPFKLFMELAKMHKEVTIYARRIVYLCELAKRSSGTLRVNEAIYEDIEKFKQETGWKVLWTDHPYLLVYPILASQQLVLNIGWIVAGSERIDDYRIPYMRGILRSVRQAIPKGLREEIEKQKQRLEIERLLQEVERLMDVEDIRTLYEEQISEPRKKLEALKEQDLESGWWEARINAALAALDLIDAAHSGTNEEFQRAEKRFRDSVRIGLQLDEWIDQGLRIIEDRKRTTYTLGEEDSALRDKEAIDSEDQETQQRDNSHQGESNNDLPDENRDAKKEASASFPDESQARGHKPPPQDPHRAKTGKRPTEKQIREDIRGARVMGQRSREKIKQAVNQVIDLVRQEDTNVAVALEQIRDTIEIRAGPFEYIWGTVRKSQVTSHPSTGSRSLAKESRAKSRDKPQATDYILYFDESFLNNPALHTELLLTLIHEARVIAYPKSLDEDNESFAQRVFKKLNASVDGGNLLQNWWDRICRLCHQFGIYFLLGGLLILGLATVGIVVLYFYLFFDLVGYFGNEPFSYGGFRSYVASLVVLGIIDVFLVKVVTFFRRSHGEREEERIPLGYSKDEVDERDVLTRYLVIGGGITLISLPFIFYANWGYIGQGITTALQYFLSWKLHYLLGILLIVSFLYHLYLKFTDEYDINGFGTKIYRAVVATLFAPICEEVIFRFIYFQVSLWFWTSVFGFFQPFNYPIPFLGVSIGFDLPLGVFIAIANNAELFFKAHGRAKWFHHWLMGVVASYAYYQTNSLIVPIVIHFIWNGIASVFSLIMNAVFPLELSIFSDRSKEEKKVKNVFPLKNFEWKNIIARSIFLISIYFGIVSLMNIAHFISYLFMISLPIFIHFIFSMKGKGIFLTIERQKWTNLKRLGLGLLLFIMIFPGLFYSLDGLLAFFHPLCLKFLNVIAYVILGLLITLVCLQPFAQFLYNITFNPKIKKAPWSLARFVVYTLVPTFLSLPIIYLSLFIDLQKNVFDWIFNILLIATIFGILRMTDYFLYRFFYRPFKIKALFMFLLQFLAIVFVMTQLSVKRALKDEAVLQALPSSPLKTFEVAPLAILIAAVISLIIIVSYIHSFETKRFHKRDLKALEISAIKINPQQFSSEMKDIAFHQMDMPSVLAFILMSSNTIEEVEKKFAALGILKDYLYPQSHLDRRKLVKIIQRLWLEVYDFLPFQYPMAFKENKLPTAEVILGDLKIVLHGFAHIPSYERPFQQTVDELIQKNLSVYFEAGIKQMMGGIQYGYALSDQFGSTTKITQNYSWPSQCYLMIKNFLMMVIMVVDIFISTIKALLHLEGEAPIKLFSTRKTKSVKETIPLFIQQQLPQPLDWTWELYIDRNETYDWVGILRSLAMLKEMVDDAKEQGYPEVHWIGGFGHQFQMSWAVDHRDEIGKLIVDPDNYYPQKEFDLKEFKFEILSFLENLRQMREQAQKEVSLDNFQNALVKALPKEIAQELIRVLNVNLLKNIRKFRGKDEHCFLVCEVVRILKLIYGQDKLEKIYVKEILKEGKEVYYLVVSEEESKQANDGKALALLDIDHGHSWIGGK